MKQTLTPQALAYVFGPESSGSTLEERASTSLKQFVRGQIQMGTHDRGATGRVHNATEALQIFGWAHLLAATDGGTSHLMMSSAEPAATLRARRLELGLNEEQLAQSAGLTLEELRQVETAGHRLPVRKLEALAHALALDEHWLGRIPHAGCDLHLGARLRDMSADKTCPGFDSDTVIALARAAWIIARQDALHRRLASVHGVPARMTLPAPDPVYGDPIHERGYQLAARTRALLGIEAEAPIASVEHLIIHTLKVPLIHQTLDARFAGATVANGALRGIVVNDAGMNADVGVRRMTLAHELGHLLWDPDDQLQRVTVDHYADVAVDDRSVPRDVVEARANGFAVALLAPPAAISRIAARRTHPLDVVRDVITTFGINAMAARHHVRNVTGLDAFQGTGDALPALDALWSTREGSGDVHCPIPSTPPCRRGAFAAYVALAVLKGDISVDSAASYLTVPIGEVTPDALQRLAAWHSDA